MDIVVHNLTSNSKIKIKCKRYIKKLAVYKDNLAALTNDKICVYNISSEEDAKLPKVLIKWEGECSLIFITSNHIVTCQQNRICLYTQEVNSKLEREWTFDSVINYLKVNYWSKISL
jgi:intraflagellar transport protein 122